MPMSADEFALVRLNSRRYRFGSWKTSVTSQNSTNEHSRPRDGRLTLQPIRAAITSRRHCDCLSAGIDLIVLNIDAVEIFVELRSLAL